MIARIPVVYHVHSPTSRDSTRTLQNWVNNATERFSLNGVDRLITVSKSLAEHMHRAGIELDRIVTVPNGVPAVGPLGNRPIPAGVWTLGTVALFRPRKGLEVLLQALARLRQDGIPVRLRAVGGFESKEYERGIHTLVKELGISDLIDWIGFTQDVLGQLAQMDLFVLSSLFGEGLPMVVLESMAAGVPVVATRVEGVPEAVRDGQDGVLAQPGSAEELQRAIRRVVGDPCLWQTLRQNAHQRHADCFSDRRMAERVADVYCSTLSPVESAVGRS
jgi:glycosyltransferase involved in cell wall biosynthesis